MSTVSSGETPPSGAFYVTGGTLSFEAASYVPRQADHDLLDGLTRGEFCYVLNTRQMGKSSLMIRTAHQLRDQGSTVAVLDLTAVGQNLTPEQWYDGLLMSLAEQLHQEDALEDYWADNTNLGPLQRFISALGKVVLPGISQRLVLFVDEIDAVRSLPFPADEFFAAIRECFNRRQIDLLYEKLTFCLLGVATPADLIQDTRMSPFNIGRRILLTDFALAEAVPLARGLAGGEAVLNRVLYWTGGHPYMTQRLCRAIAEEPGSVTPGAVDALCARLFLTKQARDTDDNLAFVRTRLLRSEVDLAALLDLYQQVRAGRKVKDDETSPLVPVLRLSGVVNAPEGLLRVRNRIYDRVFDRDWVQSHMPDAELRRQAAAYRRGVLRAASLAAVILLLMALLSGWALTASHAAQVSAWKAKLALRKVQAALSAEKSAEAQSKQEEERADKSEKKEHIEAVNAQQAARAARAANRQAQTQKQNAVHQQRLAQQQATLANHQTLLAVSNEQEAVRQRGRAAAAAAQADAEASLARRKEYDAFQQKNLAEHTQRMADLQLAGQTWESATGSASSVQDLLHRSAEAGKGSWTQRFEWRLLWNTLTAGSALTTRLDLSADSSIAITAAGSILSVDAQKQLCLTPLPKKNSDSKETQTTRRPLPDAATISCTFLSPDGTKVGAGRTDGRVDVYAADTLHLADSWKISSSPVLAGEFDSGSRTVVAWGAHAIVKKTLGADGSLTRASFPEGSRGKSISGRNQISMDMHYFAVYSNSHVTLADISEKDNTGPASQVFSNGASINGYCLSPSSALLAIGDGSGRVSVWNMSSGKKLQTWVAQSGQINTLRFSPTTRSLAVGGRNGLIQIWRLGSPRAEKPAKPVLVKSFKGHLSRIKHLVFSGNDQWLVSTEDSGITKEWSIHDKPSTAEEDALEDTDLEDTDLEDADLENSKPEGDVETLAFTPDSRTLVSTDWNGNPAASQGIHAYDRNGLPSKSFHLPPGLSGKSSQIQAVAFSPKGGAAAAAGLADTAEHPPGTPGTRCYFLQFWNPQTGQIGPRWESPPLAGNPGLGPLWGGLHRLAFSPDGRLAAGGFGDGYWSTGRYNQVVKLWDTASGREIKTLNGFRNSISAVCFTPSDKSLIVGCRDGTVRFFDTRTWAETRRLTGSAPVTSAACSLSGRTLAFSDEQGFIRLADLVTFRIRTITAHSTLVPDLAFSPDGLTLVSASWDHTLKFWDVATGRLTRTLYENNFIHRAAFSPDGTRLAYGGAFTGGGTGSLRMLQAASNKDVSSWLRQSDVKVVPPVAHWNK